MGTHRKDFVLTIDPVLNCNLRCPSCPVSNSERTCTTKTILSAERLEQILLKLKQEVKDRKINTWLYNWTEPLLHPHLDDLIQLIKRETGYVGISTNLNIKKKERIEQLLISEPNGIKISLSGFHQDIYERGHRGGEIELVKENMRFMRQFMDSHHLTSSRVWIGYHVYKDNGGDEYQAMADLAHELNFTIEPYLAYIFPLEWSIKIARGDKDIPPSIQAVLDRLAFTPVAFREIMEANVPFDPYCSWQFDVLALDAEGSVDLCCASFNQKLGINYLDTPLDEIHALQAKHAFCRECQAVRLHQNDRHITPKVLDDIQDGLLEKLIGTKNFKKMR